MNVRMLLALVTKNNRHQPVRLNTNQHGDTLVEVLLATVILSTVIASGYALTIRATQINQDSIERTQVVQFLQEQAELLRLARANDDRTSSSAWTQILNNELVLSSPAFDCVGQDLDMLTNGFHLTVGSDDRITKVDGPVRRSNTSSNESVYYLWIDGIDKSPSFKDFVVNACWDGLSNTVEQQSGLVVRLEPS